MSLIRGAMPVSGNGPPVYDVVPESGETDLDLTVVGDFVLGTLCHWVVNDQWPRGRTRVCEMYQGDCPYCGLQRDIWFGWLACYCHNRRARVVLRAAKESIESLKATLKERESPRGRRYDVRRQTAGGTSALVFTKSEKHPLVPLIQSHDCHETVCRVLGCRELPPLTFRAQEIGEGKL